jgi:hypothetical protein
MSTDSEHAAPKGKKGKEKKPSAADIALAKYEKSIKRTQLIRKHVSQSILQLVRGHSFIVA